MSLNWGSLSVVAFSGDSARGRLIAGPWTARGAPVDSLCAAGDGSWLSTLISLAAVGLSTSAGGSGTSPGGAQARPSLCVGTVAVLTSMGDLAACSLTSVDSSAVTGTLVVVGGLLSSADKIGT